MDSFALSIVSSQNNKWVAFNFIWFIIPTYKCFLYPCSCRCLFIRVNGYNYPPEPDFLENGCGAKAIFSIEEIFFSVGVSVNLASALTSAISGTFTPALTSDSTRAGYCVSTIILMVLVVVFFDHYTLVKKSSASMILFFQTFRSEKKPNSI